MSESLMFYSSLSSYQSHLQTKPRGKRQRNYTMDYMDQSSVIMMGTVTSIIKPVRCLQLCRVLLLATKEVDMPVLNT